jgi:hypothetical protein
VGVVAGGERPGVRAEAADIPAQGGAGAQLDGFTGPDPGCGAGEDAGMSEAGLQNHRYVEAPQEWADAMEPRKAVFLAGGITGCPDWQRQMRDLLCESGLLILNPRRRNFPIDDPAAAQQQIEWEYRHLRKADLILFWFCAATLNPIVLYEMGAWSMTDKPIAIGVEPGYARAQDVVIQTKLTRPDVKICSSLRDLATATLKLASRDG